jgi:hypothetical protein
MNLFFLLLVGFSAHLGWAAEDCHELDSPPTVEESSAVTEIIAAVKTQPMVQFDLPYEQTPSLKAQLLPLPWEVATSQKTTIQFAYFGKEQEVIPAYRRVESYHAIVRRFEGFYYYMCFESPESRELFIQEFSQVYLAAGDIAGSKPRYGLFLTPEQFQKLSEKFLVTGAEPDERNFRRVFRRDIANLRELFPAKTSDEIYYFNSRGELKAMSKAGKYYVYEPPAIRRKTSMASHIAILARQNPNLDLSRFEDRPSGGEDPAVMVLANAEIEAVLKNVNDYLMTSGNEKLKAEMEEAQKNLLGAMKINEQVEKDVGDRNSGLRFYLGKWLNKRREIFANFIVGGLNDESSAVAKSLVKFSLNFFSSIERKEGGSSIFRFVWLKGVSVEAGGLILGRANELFHEQLARLALGDAYKKFEQSSVLRGGILKVDYDPQGRPLKFTVVNSAMHALIDGKVETFRLSDSEKSNFELMLYNAATGGHH